MSEWKEYKLGDLISDNSAELQTGPFGTMLNASEYVLDGTPVIAVQDIGENKLIYHKFVYVDESTTQRLSRYKVKENDIIFGRKGSVGRRALIKKHEEGWLQGSDCIRLRFFDKVDPIFASYQFGTNYYQEWMFQNAGGATMPSLNQSVLKELPMRFTNISEQKSIASILSSIDDKIDLLHRQNITLEKMAETLFRQWFVEEAKEDWEFGPLGSFVNIAYGKNLPTKNLLPSGYPVFGGNGQIGFFDRYIYEEPQVLVSCRGEASGVVNISFKYSYVTNNSLILEIGKRSEITFEFLKYSSLNTDFKTYVSGSAQPQITIEGLYSAEFVLPPEDLINKFTEVVRKWELKRTNNQTQIRTLTALRDTLLPKLMSGEIRIKI